MNIDTKYHGSVEIKESQILTFEKGIPGFPLEKQFALLPLTDDDIFYVMQSISTPGLAFVLTSPFNFFEEYDFDLEELVISELVLKSQNDVLVYSILSVQDPFEKTTANLQAPVIINSKNRRAKQVILHDEQYNTKHPIIKKTGTKGDQ